MGMMRLLSDACTLMTRHWEKTQGWQSMLAPEISRRLGGPDPVIDMRANALAAAAISCLDAAADAGPQAAGPLDAGPRGPGDGHPAGTGRRFRITHHARVLGPPLRPYLAQGRGQAASTGNCLAVAVPNRPRR